MEKAKLEFQISGMSDRVLVGQLKSEKWKQIEDKDLRAKAEEYASLIKAEALKRKLIKEGG